MISEAVISDALNGPGGLFIEHGCAPLQRQAGGIALTVRTGTAFYLPVAALVLEALKSRLPLDTDTAAAIELALHEAVANAVLHGNLECGSDWRDGTEDHHRFCRSVDARMRDPGLAMRRVGVTATWTARRLRLTITDEGKGFPGDPADQTHGGTSDGRGFSLMRQLAETVQWHQPQRTLILSFDTSPRTGS